MQNILDNCSKTQHTIKHIVHSFYLIFPSPKKLITFNDHKYLGFAKLQNWLQHPFLVDEGSSFCRRDEAGSDAGRLRSAVGIGSGADDWFYWLEN